MPRKRQRRELQVAMNGYQVGRLASAPDGVLGFQYDPEWIAADHATPISLALPLSPDPYSGEVVLNFFDNLLPDNEDIRRRIQIALGTESTRPFDLLASTGGDCVGALQLFASTDMPDVRQVTAILVSDEEIARILREYRQRPLGMSPEEDDFRISMAGTQEKTAFLWYRNGWHRPQGTTPTTHVFKLPISSTAEIDLSTSVENEWLCLRLAAALGLPVPSAEIREFDGVKVLIVERFDRRWSDDQSWIIRLPQEDMCQSLGLSPARKYEADGGPGIVQIMDLLLQSQRSIEDQRTFFRACVVYWLLCAIDGHAKNFSIYLQPGGRCTLTPVYDILSAYPLTAARQLEAQKLKMAMAVIGKNRHYRWREIRPRHWLSTAKACRFSEREAKKILEGCARRIEPAVEEAQENLPEGFPEEVAGPILNGLLSMQKSID